MVRGVDCDLLLRRHIVSDPSARTSMDVNRIISVIQNRNRECHPDSWGPVSESPSEACGRFKGKGSNCDHTEIMDYVSLFPDKGCRSAKPGGLPVPPNLKYSLFPEALELPGLGLQGDDVYGDGKEVAAKDYPVFTTYRFPRGDIVVWFARDGLPWGKAVCWIYHSRYSLWVGGDVDGKLPVSGP